MRRRARRAQTAMSVPDALSLPVSFALAHTPWTVDRIAQIDDFLQRCQRLEHAPQGPFQHSTWLRSWYGSLAGRPDVEPLLLAARAEGDVRDALLMPMIVRRVGPLRLVEAADLGLSDCCGPLVRDGLVLSDGDAGALRHALREALQDCDAIRLDKLPLRLETGPNPWVRLIATQPGTSALHRLRMADDLRGPLLPVAPAGGHDLERCWRAFRTAPDARFVVAGSVEEGLRLLRQVVILQQRGASRASRHAPDAPGRAELEERFLRENLGSGRCVVAALKSRDELVAGLLGIFAGPRLTVLRGASGDPRWDWCEPGALLLERSVGWLHPTGCRELDFGAGGTALARAIGASPVAMTQACMSLSIFGQAYRGAWRLRRALRRPLARAGTV
jgi:CelD/BcsL family acetyltransferase involved in cellulose biosynthesis